MKTQDQMLWHLSEEDMLLYQSNELSSDLKRQADIHLDRCKECQVSLKETQNMVNQFKAIQLKQASGSTVAMAHQNLMQKIYRGDLGFKRNVRTKPAMVWMAIAASLIVGFFAGRTSVFHTESNGYEALLTAYQMMEYGKVQINSATQEISITLPKVENQVLKGSMADAGMQQMAMAILKHDARDDVRINVMKMIDSNMLLENQELSGAIMYVLEHDTNPGLRLRAMRLLSRLPVSPELIAVLKRILMKDEIEGVRVQAAQYLVSEDFEAQSAFIKQIAKEESYMQSLVLRAEMPLS